MPDSGLRLLAMLSPKAEAEWHFDRGGQQEHSKRGPSGELDLNLGWKVPSYAMG
jgi:hypothetical protein